MGRGGGEWLHFYKPPNFYRYRPNDNELAHDTPKFKKNANSVALNYIFYWPSFSCLVISYDKLQKH